MGTFGFAGRPNTPINLSHFLGRLREGSCFGYSSMTTGAGSYDSILFVQNACQYYATARFAMHAQCMPVCGILFHHTVEMLLKGGLAQQRELCELEKMGHRLKKLWRAFKEDFPDPGLIRHDTTISRLDKFDAIRYPDDILKYGMGTTAQWRGPAAEVITHGGIQTPRQYVIVVSDIDDLIADVFKISSWNPGTFMGTNPAALEAITRCNDHSEFLIKRF
jgi:hypothetical protein